MDDDVYADASTRGGGADEAAGEEGADSGDTGGGGGSGSDKAPTGDKAAAAGRDGGAASADSADGAAVAADMDTVPITPVAGEPPGLGVTELEVRFVDKDKNERGVFARARVTAGTRLYFGGESCAMREVVRRYGAGRRRTHVVEVLEADEHGVEDGGDGPTRAIVDVGWWMLVVLSETWERRALQLWRSEQIRRMQDVTAVAVNGVVEEDLTAPERTRAQGWLAYQLDGELPEDRLVAFSDAGKTGTATAVPDREGRHGERQRERGGASGLAATATASAGGASGEGGRDRRGLRRRSTIRRAHQ
jgi:hypothetical protein